jgi:hypothetical protein
MLPLLLCPYGAFGIRQATIISTCGYNRIANLMGSGQFSVRHYASYLATVAQAEFRLSGMPLAVFTIRLGVGLLPYALSDAFAMRKVAPYIILSPYMVGYPTTRKPQMLGNVRSNPLVSIKLSTHANEEAGYVGM